MPAGWNITGAISYLHPSLPPANDKSTSQREINRLVMSALQTSLIIMIHMT